MSKYIANDEENKLYYDRVHHTDNTKQQNIYSFMKPMGGNIRHMQQPEHLVKAESRKGSQNANERHRTPIDYNGKPAQAECVNVDVHLGLFANNQRISSSKEYFHQIGKSLNRETRDKAGHSVCELITLHLLFLFACEVIV